MPDRVKVFLSYSETKSPDRAATRAAVRRARTVLTERLGWAPVDAMEADVLSIATKVRTKLFDSDCIIADVTSSSPNVMFEVGFAFALGYPVVLLLNFEAFDNPEYRAYFDVLGHSTARPTAADLGDMEYLVYPASTAPEAEWTRFEDRLGEVLAQVRGHFTPEVRLLRRAARRFYAGVFDFMQAHRPSNPIVGFLAGRLHYSAEGLRSEGTHVFVTLAHYYADAMKAFAGATPDGDLRTVRAVADLGQSSESLWTGADDPLGVRIRERLFAVPTAMFFDGEAMERLAAVFRRQGALHEVWAVPRERLDDLRPPLDGAIGYDMLLMGPDIVGGYVSRPLGGRHEPHLYVRRSDDGYLKAGQFYDAARRRAFPVRGVESGADLVRAWLAHSGTGTWQPEWSAKVETRPPQYFRDYDDNIRCWVPAYLDLIEQTGDVVCHLLLERLRATRDPLAVLELGCGTGALTEVLARWVEQLDAPHRKVGRPGAVDRLVALDPATQMQRATRERVERRFKGAPPFLLVSPGRAPDSLPRAVGDRKYDVICGSLVLHDLLDGCTEEQVVGVVAKLARRLAPGGSLVFADIFPDDRPDARREQLAEWARWMRESAGLPDDAVRRFLEANRDMTGAVSADALRRAARRCSDEAVESANEEARGAPGGCPFRVVALTFPAPVV